MRRMLFAAALLCGTAALAQDYPAATPDPAVAPDATTMEEPAPMPQTTMTAQLPTGTAVAPDNSNPERDARGIPVISDPAVAPPGFNQPAGSLTGMGGPLVDASQAPAPQPATQDYPPCTRTVTDHCLQTYERGRSPTG